MATSEIEKLERRYAENPHGLTFAPLAEVHRKIGDVPRALELLTAGLELHPNYIPASIVLGRCHQDQGNLAAAEAAFAHVLRLDDENVIALKSLADIKERQERYADAETWLRRLVAIDRSNEEAREQLERVEAARQSSPAEEAPPSEPEPAPVAAEAPVRAVAAEAPDPVLEMIDLTPEPAPVQEEPAAAEPIDAQREAREVEPEVVPAEPRPPEPEVRPPEIKVIYEPPTPTDIHSDDEAPAPIASSQDSLKSDTGDRADEEVQPLPGLISAEFQPPLEATGGLGVETSEDVVLEASGHSEFSVPDASEDLKSVAARLAAPPAPPAPIQETEAAPPAVRDEPPVKVERAPEFALTETMAEVLARHGYPEDALRIYRELVRRSGDNPELETRIRDLESAPVGLPRKQKSYRARETNGQSVGAFLQAMLAATVAGTPEGGHREGTGRVDSAAGNGGGILESSYGEDGSLPVPPAVPSEAPAESGVSFDDFFQPESDESTLRQGKGEPGKDDLDQFQTWLQNLKR